jgi:phage terminase small subunit
MATGKKKTVSKVKPIRKADSIAAKHERFCQEYLIDLIGTQAYIRAFNGGTATDKQYNTARTESSKLLALPNIVTRIRQLMDLRSKDTLVDAKYVVDELVELVTRCKQKVPVLEWDNEEKCIVQSGEWKFDSIGANKALELLGKHVAMFTEKPASAPLQAVLSDDQFERVLQSARQNAGNKANQG